MYGGFRETELSGHQERILQHVRETDTEWPMYRFHAAGYTLDAVSCARFARFIGGFRAEEISLRVADVVTA